MKIPKEVIDKLLELAIAPSSTNAITDCDINGIANGNFKGIKRFLIEMKVQIDRWDLLTSIILVHPDMMKFISFSLKNEIGKSSDGKYSIWGAVFLVDDSVPINTVISLANLTDLPDLMEEYGDARYLAIGKLDFEVIERMNKLKVFW